MATANPLISSFNAGELTPLLDGRPDHAKYYSGCRKLENMIPLPHGGATERPGTYFVASTKDHNRKCRLLRFEFSTTQAYILEFGHYYIRFYKDGGQITSGGVPYEVATGYAEDELFELQFAQSADTLYIAHQAHNPAQLTRTGHTSWTFGAITFTDGPYLEENTTDITLTPSGTVVGTSITLTASDNLFDADMVGGWFRLKHGSTWGYVAVTAYISATEVTASVMSTLGDTTATDVWREGAWSAYRGYPACVCFFEERLCWAGSPTKPQTIWLSSTGSFFDHTPDGTDSDDAMALTILSDRVNVIRWMVPQNYIIAGTVGAEWRIGGASSSDPITPTSVNAKRQSTYGSNTVQGILINDVVVFVQRQGRKLRELVYNYDADVFAGRDLTLLAEHITNGRDSSDNVGIVSMDYQNEPYSLLWAVRYDGQLLCLSYERSEEIGGWSRMITQEVTGGSFESVAVIPGDEEDEVWVSVKRTINGVTKRYIEYFKAFSWPDDKEDCFHVDSGLTWDGGDPAAITNITLANPVVIYATNTLSNGDNVRLTEVGGTEELNDNVYTVANATGSSFELSGIDGSAFTAYTGGGLFQQVENSFDGLSHLANMVAAVCAEGGALDEVTISSGGTVTLDDYYSKVHIGLPFTARLQPMKIEAGGVKGTSRGQTKRISHLTANFYKTLACSAGPDEDNLTEIVFDQDDDPYTGEKDIPFKGRHEVSGDILLVNDKPLPLTVLSIAAFVDTYERR
ncbi:MAG: hypothetical protein A4E67_01025 [Syntrophaceae bacterium PtaB.Bin038]|nr:MAG: hypothetical protein A4E67_01025 [Syntrophaceae bacterium PtaB.Bin038]